MSNKNKHKKDKQRWFNHRIHIIQEEVSFGAECEIHSNSNKYTIPFSCLNGVFILLKEEHHRPFVKNNDREQNPGTFIYRDPYVAWSSGEEGYKFFFYGKDGSIHHKSKAAMQVIMPFNRNPQSHPNTFINSPYPRKGYFYHGVCPQIQSTLDKFSDNMEFASNEEWVLFLKKYKKVLKEA